MLDCDWSSDVCSSDLGNSQREAEFTGAAGRPVERQHFARQTQFNPAQLQTHKLLGAVTAGLTKMPPAEKRWFVAQPLHATQSQEEVLVRGLPGSAPIVSGSEASIGLQIVDVYLWLFNRVLTDAELSPELWAFWHRFGPETMIDGIWMQGLQKRFSEFDQLLPAQSDLKPEHHEMNARATENHRAKVKQLLEG
jgi:hypothetical protein